MAAYDFDRENNNLPEEDMTPSEAPVVQEPAEEKKPEAPHTTSSYDPYGTYREPYRPAGDTQETPRAGRARTVLLCSMLALAMLVVSFFGGAAFGRFTNYGSLPNIGGEPNNNNNTPGSGNGNGNQTGIPGINRGDVVLNVIERDPAEYGERDIPAVVAKVQDTVVEIRTETTVTSAYYGDYVQSGAGSGVIVSQDGLILTCDHVITGAGTITVVLTDGREFVAEVYGEDSWSDLALIKIDATGLPAAEMPAAATKDDVTYKSYLAVGEEVVAIGNPLGELGGSVSNGIISALGRNVNVEGVPMTLMQTNAAVNPGNSGGGLFNMYGELIGIVNAKSTGDSVEGIGFAIPVSDAIVIYKQLYSQGYVSGRPYLGLYFEETTNGLKIISYDYNSELPEGKSIQNGDMLYSVDGKVITSFSGLKNVLAKKKVGDTVVIQIERYERRGYSYVRIPLELTITVHEYIPVQGN